MGVKIDKARRHQPAIRIDDLVRRPGNGADGGNLPAPDGDIRGIGLAAPAIRDHSVSDENIKMHLTISRSALSDFLFLFSSSARPREWWRSKALPAPR